MFPLSPLYNARDCGPIYAVSPSDGRYGPPGLVSCSDSRDVSAAKYRSSVLFSVVFAASLYGFFLCQWLAYLVSFAIKNRSHGFSRQSELCGYFGLGQSAVVELVSDRNLSVGIAQFSAVMLNSNLSGAVDNLVIYVALMRVPSQVADAIVLRVSIIVAAFHVFWTRASEGFKNDAAHGVVITNAVDFEGYVFSVTSGTGPQYSALNSTESSPTSDPPSYGLNLTRIGNKEGKARVPFPTLCIMQRHGLGPLMTKVIWGWTLPTPIPFILANLARKV